MNTKKLQHISLALTLSLLALIGVLALLGAGNSGPAPVYAQGPDSYETYYVAPDCGGLTSPVITAGGNFIVGSMGSPYIKGYKLSTSENQEPKLLWQLRTEGVMYESLPAVSGNMAFFLPNDGYIYAIK